VERADLLIAGYIDRELAPAEADELLSLVRGDPAVRADLLALARLERQLAAERGPIDLVRRVAAALRTESAPGSDAQWVERVMGDVRRTRRPARPRRGRRGTSWPLLMALAAGLAAAFATFQWLSHRPQETAPPALPVVETTAPAPATPAVIATSTGVVLRANARLDSGTALHAGDAIGIGDVPGGWTYADGTAIIASPGTTAVVGGTTAGGKRIALGDGGLTAIVVPQPEGRPLVVTTRHLEATVVGTRFTIAASAATRLAVSEGRIQARIGGFSALISARQEITAGPDGVHVLDWSLAGRWDEVLTMGTVRPAAAGAEAAIASIATRPEQRNPWFDPDQQICLQGAMGMGRVELVRLPPGFRLRLRLRAERDGEAMLTMEELGPAPRQGGLGSRRFAVGPAWREVVLTTADFDQGGSGASVRSVSVWGFGIGTLELAACRVERTP